MYSNKNSFLERYQNLSEGMAVYSRDGEKLGKIVMMGDDDVTIEKGFFFPKDFYCRYDDIDEIRDDAVYLKLNREDLSDWRDSSYTGWSQTDDINTGRLNAQPRDEYRDLYKDRFIDKQYENRTTTEQVKVPIAEEQLEANKVMRQKGELRLRKVVHTEYRHFTVPVTKEEVHVERVPVTDTGTTAAPLEGSFKEETISVPIMEEEVTVSKRPVVKEEVRISKDRRTEEKTVEGEIRKESVNIEGEDRLKRKAG